MKPLALVCFVTAIAMLAWVVIHDETDEAPNIELANQSEDRNELTEPILSNSSNLPVNPDQIDPKKQVMVSRELQESLDSKKRLNRSGRHLNWIKPTKLLKKHFQNLKARKVIRRSSSGSKTWQKRVTQKA